MQMITCNVGVVVALQPGLHTNQIVFIHEEDDIFGPKNLICKHRVNVTKKCNSNIFSMLSHCVGERTPKVMSQAEQQSHRLVVVVSRTAGSSENQRFGPWSSRGPKDPIYICAFHQLPIRDNI